MRNGTSPMTKPEPEKFHERLVQQIVWTVNGAGEEFGPDDEVDTRMLVHTRVGTFQIYARRFVEEPEEFGHSLLARVEKESRARNGRTWYQR